MGRLIDADKLKAAVECHEVASVLPLNDYEYGYNSGIERAVIEIEDAEPVEAIPVKDLKRIAHALRYSEDYAVRVVGCAIPGIIAQWEEGEWEEEQKGN